MLALLDVQETALVCLKLGSRFFELACHLIVPIFDALEHALVFVVLVLADLLLCLLNLLLFERRERSEVISELFQVQVCLVSVLLVASVAVCHVVAQRDCLLHDFLECLFEHACGYLITDLSALFLLALSFGLIGFFLGHANLLCLRLGLHLFLFNGWGLLALGDEEVIFFVLVNTCLLQGSFLRLKLRLLDVAVLHLL